MQRSLDLRRSLPKHLFKLLCYFPFASSNVLIVGRVTWMILLNAVIHLNVSWHAEPLSLVALASYSVKGFSFVLPNLRLDVFSQLTAVDISQSGVNRIPQDQVVKGVGQEEGCPQGVGEGGGTSTGM